MYFIKKTKPKHFVQMLWIKFILPTYEFISVALIPKTGLVLKIREKEIHLSVFFELSLKNWKNWSNTSAKEEVQLQPIKHFWKLKPRKLVEIYCPTLLFCSVFHWASSTFKVPLSLHRAKTWRSKFWTTVQGHLWEDLLELQDQGNYTAGARLV